MTRLERRAAGTRPVVRVGRKGPVLWLQIDRPHVRNALDTNVVAALDDGLDAAERDPSVRAVAITGTGRAFCSGGDVRMLADPGSGAALRRFRNDFGRLLGRIESHPLPVLAAVNGATVAGGLELILACDLVVAAADAHIGDGHVLNGLIPGAGGSVRLPGAVGRHRAAELLYTGELHDAALLQAWGLVNEVVEPSELTDTIEAFVGRLGARDAVTRIKALFRETATCATRSAALQVEDRHVERHMRTDAFRKAPN
ncbi:enoyl-CoA hydratase/isomerase family protein [Pseudonocardia dioxanivorans]|uniref:enoyl-CoA hydratase/isomerase family protein n=1 Tax=Pseudonocardia dioxanivorans TaxID=240495 RepID=UPI001404A79E|nr:enoyl-CoA hydratase/isomerase family protein [Pseudonocardia dioxanivorans]